MKPKEVIFFAVFTMIFTFPVFAQSDYELTATFSTDLDILSFDYPESWRVNYIDGFIAIYPDETESPELDGVEFRFNYIVVPHLLRQEVLTPDMLIEEAFNASQDAITSSTRSLIDEMYVSEVGTNTVASIRSEGSTSFHVNSLIETENGWIVGEFRAPEDMVTEVELIYLDIIATIEYNPIDILAGLDLPRRYTNQETTISFNYPEGWAVDVFEDGINLTPDWTNFPELHMMSILFIPIDEEIVEQLNVTSDMSAEEVAQALIDFEENEDITYDIIEIADYGENHVASYATFEEGFFGTYLISAVETGDDTIIVQVRGDEEQLTLIRNIYFDIIGTITMGSIGRRG